MEVIPPLCFVIRSGTGFVPSADQPDWGISGAIFESSADVEPASADTRIDKRYRFKMKPVVELK